VPDAELVLPGGEDVRMVKGGGELGLALEAAKAGILGQLGGDQLQGDGALQTRLLGPVDDPMPPWPTTASIR
jgi:hypothetical protein